MFPEDLVADIDPAAVLRMIGNVIPDPFKEPFMQIIDQLSEMVALLPIVEKVRKHDFKGAVALIPSVPVVKLLMKLNEGVACEVLRTIFLAKELQTVAETTLSNGPETLHAPMAELQTFCRRIERGMSAGELLEGLDKIRSSFTALASGDVDFMFPEDLVADIDPAVVLRMIANALPEPLLAYRRTMINALNQQLVEESGNVLEILRESVSDPARSADLLPVADIPDGDSSLKVIEAILLPGEAD